MIECTLTRMKTGDDGTKGFLRTPTQIFDSIELPWRDNKSQVSCHADGTYVFNFVKTPKHPTGVYMMRDSVRPDTEIHAGNYAGDVSLGYRSDVLGCILLGEGTDIWPVGTLKQAVVTGSRDAIQKFQTEMNGEDMTLTISCAEGVGPFTAPS